MSFEHKKQRRVSARAASPSNGFKDKQPSLDVEQAIPSIMKAAKARVMDLRAWIKESPELALSVFTQGLLQGTSEVRVDSIIRIGLVFNEGFDISPALPHLIRAVSDSDESVKYNAAGLLACFYLDYERINEARLLLKSKDIIVKTAAIEALGGDAEEGRHITPLILDLVHEAWNPDRNVGALAYMTIHNAARYGDQQALRYISWIAERANSEGVMVH